MQLILSAAGAVVAVVMFNFLRVYLFPQAAPSIMEEFEKEIDRN